MFVALDPHPEAELELHELVDGSPSRAQEVGKILRDYDGLLADPAAMGPAVAMVGETRLIRFVAPPIQAIVAVDDRGARFVSAGDLIEENYVDNVLVRALKRIAGTSP